MFQRLSEPEGPTVTVNIEGEDVRVPSGESVAAAVLAHGLWYTRTTRLSGTRRAPLCIVAGALRLNVGGEGVVFQHAINGAAPLDLGANGGDGVHRLPGNLPIPDGAIAACHRLRESR